MVADRFISTAGLVLLLACSTATGQSDYLPLKHHSQDAPLSTDTALVYVNSTGPVYLCAQVDVCDQCSLLPTSHDGDNPPAEGDQRYFAVDTRWGVNITVSQNKSGSCTTADLCWLHVYPKEYGHYTLHVFHDAARNEGKCDFKGPEPSDSNIPIYVALGIFAGLACISILINFSYRKNLFRKIQSFFENDRLVFSDLGAPSTNVSPKENNSVEPVTHEPPKKQRVRSVDTFRGMCLTVMIFVNYGGGDYWFFDHSYWNGITVADLVMPWFTFIIGTSVALSLHKLLMNGVPRRVLVWKVIKRTLILFAIGLFLNTDDCDEQDLTQLRIPGVLQRLAASYFMVAIVHIFCAQVDDPHRHKKWAVVRDVLPYWPEWLLNLAILAVHLCLTFLLPVPGCPTGYLGPGGLHMNSTHRNCTGGAAAYIDRWVFGANHIYQTPTCRYVYHTEVPHDPEGILGTLTSVFMCFLGLQAGKILLIHKDWQGRVIRWLAWFVCLGAIGGGLCKFSQNDGLIPICKNLWSVTFVLSLASMAFFLLTIFYLLIDVYNMWSGTPFFYPGMNSILVYICHDVFGGYFPVSWKVPETHASQLAMHLWGAGCWTLVAMVLYHKKIFVII